MNSNSIGFSNNGAGLTWGNNYSRIYDNGNLYITTDDYLNISAPTQVNITSANTYFTGNVYTNNNLLASQTWVQSQNYLTTSPSSLTVGTLMGNPIVSYANSTCYIQCLTSTNNNWIQFHANNATTDAQLVTAGTSGNSNTGNFNFYCGNAVFNSPITMGYGGITMSSGGYGGSIGAGIVQNVGGYLTLNAVQGATYEVLRVQYVNGVGPSCSFSAPIQATSLTVNNGIVLNSTSAPPTINYIGYSNVVSLNGNVALAWGTYNNLLSVTISTPGTYDFDAQILYAYTTAYSSDNVCTYAISLSPSTTDINCLPSAYTAGKLNINLSFYSGVQPLTTRRVLYISSTTTVYLICYYSGGTSNSASANTSTLLRYTRIA